MTFSTQTDAKRFIVAKVIEQAEREGVNLSPAERHMLSWSESDPDFVPDPALADAQESEISQGDFEGKIVGLIRRAYERDVVANEATQRLCREAQAKLHEGDHYILVMMDQAVRSKLRRWWPF